MRTEIWARPGTRIAIFIAAVVGLVCVGLLLLLGPFFSAGTPYDAVAVDARNAFTVVEPPSPAAAPAAR